MVNHLGGSMVNINYGGTALGLHPLGNDIISICGHVNICFNSYLCRQTAAYVVCGLVQGWREIQGCPRLRCFFLAPTGWCGSRDYILGTGLVIWGKCPPNKSLAAPGLSIFYSSPRAVVHLWAADM